MGFLDEVEGFRGEADGNFDSTQEAHSRACLMMYGLQGLQLSDKHASFCWSWALTLGVYYETCGKDLVRGSEMQ